jgi:hypothetical protein
VRQGKRWARETAEEKNCSGMCVRCAWLCLVAVGMVVCVCWQRLTGSGVVAWVRLHVYGGIGGEGGGSRVKGKERKDSWLDE